MRGRCNGQWPVAMCPNAVHRPKKRTSGCGSCALPSQKRRLHAAISMCDIGHPSLLLPSLSGLCHISPASSPAEIAAVIQHVTAVTAGSLHLPSNCTRKGSLLLHCIRKPPASSVPGTSGGTLTTWNDPFIPHSAPVVNFLAGFWSTRTSHLPSLAPSNGDPRQHQHRRYPRQHQHCR